jgi:hypothetical protein
MRQMLNQLKAAKEKYIFTPEAWAERGLNPSDEARQKEMQTVVHEFIDLTTEHIEANGSVDEEGITDILYDIEEGIYDDFDTEEREWVYDIFLDIASDLGLDVHKIMREKQADFLAENPMHILQMFEQMGIKPDEPMYVEAKNNSIALAKKMKKDNEPIENIVKNTGLSKAEIEDL